MRKVVGFLVAALALASGGLVSRSLDASRANAIKVETGRLALAAAQRAAEGMSAVVSDLKLKAENAAANPRLLFALQGNVDEATMRDLWRTEDWWRPWRAEFKVYAVAVTSLRLDVAEGIDAADLDSESLIRHVRERGEGAADIIAGKGWPYGAAAALVKVPGRETSPVLLVAKPLDQALVRRLADKSGGAVSLTNGRKSLIDAGPDSERAVLAQAVGSEGAGPLFHGKDGSWAAASVPIAPGLWLWSFASAEAVAHDAQEAATERKAVLWTSALGLAALALVFALRRPRYHPTAATTATGPMTPTSEILSLDPRQTERSSGPTLPFLSGVTPPEGRPQQPAARITTEGLPSTMPDGDQPGALVNVATALMPGLPEAPFGRYTLLDRLGEGGMAEVYTAVTFGAEGFRRKFVIKRLRAELARDPAVVDQFIDEANLASTMVHSNIVPVFDFGKVGEEYFMAQEYILGRDLSRLSRRHIEQDGLPLPVEVVLYASHETLKALEYAHTKSGEHGEALGIVHRDVSPTNIIVSARGEVKLFDFGIVKAEGRVTKTESGIVKGNVTFMSPEQARGTAVDGRADLFSLGLVMYYCLTGHVLYAGNTTYELLLKAATGPGSAEFDQLRALPEPCGAILERALQVAPEDRFQTAREFGEAIAAHVGGGAARLGMLMHHLFSEDFKMEEARFRPFGPTGPAGAAGPGTLPYPPARRRS